MKKFAAFKTSGQILRQCEALGLEIDWTEYEQGGDCITVRSRVPAGELAGFVRYNVTNGNFTGGTDKGLLFTSEETVHDEQPWFQMLLEFFYVPKDGAA